MMPFAGKMSFALMVILQLKNRTCSSLKSTWLCVAIINDPDKKRFTKVRFAQVKALLLLLLLLLFLKTEGIKGK